MSRVLHYTGTSDNINLLSWNASLSDAHGNEVATVRTKRFHTAGSITLSATDTRLAIFRQDQAASSSSSSANAPTSQATPSSAPPSPHANQQHSSSSHGFNLPGSPRRRRRHHHSQAHSGAANASFVARPTSSSTSAAAAPQRHSTDQSRSHSHQHHSSSSAKWLVVQSSETVAAVRLGSSLAVSLASGERYVLSPSGGDPRQGFTVLRMPGRGQQHHHSSSSGSTSAGRPTVVGQVTPGGKSSLFKTTFRIALKSSTAHSVPDMLPALLLFVVHAALDARAGERVAVTTAPQIALTAAVGASVC